MTETLCRPLQLSQRGDESMEIMTIGELSKNYEVSTRMIRYYEKMGLITSQRKKDYAYRVYDELAVRRLQQIIVLRKLRIPLKHIAVILNDHEQVQALELMRENIFELDEEINALSIIRDILNVFILRLDESIRKKVQLDILQDNELVDVVNALSLSKNSLKEDRSMDDLNKASDNIQSKLNVRIILLPPCTVASYHYIGENPEEKVGNMMSKFILENKLYEIKPDARMFGFNHPSPSKDKEFYGYEDWVTIPDDMEVSAPFIKKHFEGGLYAAHAINFPDFHEWAYLLKWVEESDLYTANYSELGDEIMGGLLEEHLNWIYSCHVGWPKNGIDGKIDLLFPIKKKS